MTTFKTSSEQIGNGSFTPKGRYHASIFGEETTTTGLFPFPTTDADILTSGWVDDLADVVDILQGTEGARSAIVSEHADGACTATRTFTVDLRVG